MPEIAEPTWWIAGCEDSEAWTGPYETREVAIAEAHANDWKWVVVARQALFLPGDLIPSIDDLIDRWRDDSEGLVGPDDETPFDHLTAPQQASLHAHLVAAANAWALSEGVAPKPAWMFHFMGKAERVPAAAEAPA